MARKYGKVDLNQGEIVAALRQQGCIVQSLASVGDGCPDLLIGHNGRWLVFEVKRPGEALTEKERRWHAQARACGCAVPVVETVEDALWILGIRPEWEARWVLDPKDSSVRVVMGAA